MWLLAHLGCWLVHRQEVGEAQERSRGTALLLSASEPGSDTAATHMYAA
jgi:hypothetical protein